MLEALSFCGTTRVINNGTDAVLLCRPAGADCAMKAAKQLGVCGVSTAVLAQEEGQTPDVQAIAHFAKQNKLFAIMGETLAQDVNSFLSEGVRVSVLTDWKAESICRTIFALDRARRQEADI